MYSLHQLLMKTYLQMKRQVSAQATPLGLSPGQPKVLEFLAQQGEHEQKDIADYCEIEPATVGSLLLRMETAGLVTRRNRPHNRRSLYVSLTPKGEELAGILQGIFQEAEGQITANLTEEEEKDLVRLLAKCLEHGKGNRE